MDSVALQQELFGYLRLNIPAHLSLVDDLCELLSLSPDSVYRRIRGEKPITLEELKKICDHYHLSLDQLLQLKSESVLFDAPGLNGMPAPFSAYLQAMVMQFKYFNSFRNRDMQYLCKDSTIWNFYLFPEMAAFKTFFWSKTINNQPDLADESFSLQHYPYTDCYELGRQVIREYNTIPSVEMWNLESMQSTINQIAYYRDAGLFKTQSDFDAVVQSFLRLIDHLQLQASKGVKFMPGDTEVSYRAPIQYYVNELILGNNTMIITLDSKPMTMITYSVFHYLFTRDERFAKKVSVSFESLISRSTHISKTGEKDRNRFFNALREKVKGLHS